MDYHGDYFFENSSIPMIDFDIDGNIIGSNASSRDFFGNSVEQLDQLFDRENINFIKSKIIQKKTNEEFTLSQPDSSGETVLKLSVTPLEETPSKYRMMVLSSDRNKLLNNVSDDIMLIMDELDFIYIQVNSSKIILYHNSRAEELLDVKSGMRLDQAVDDKISTILSNCIKFRQGCSKLVEVNLGDQQKSWLINVIEADEFYHVVIEDVTKIRKSIQQNKYLENKIVETEQLRTIGQLAGGIAHDFNNLLTIISTNIEVMRYEISEDNLMNRLIDDVEIATDRAGNLVDKLLNYSKKSGFSLEPMNISSVIDGMKSLLKRVLPHEINLQIRTFTSKIIVNIDKSGLENTILNLVLNARDAMEGKPGTIRITTSVEMILKTKFDVISQKINPGRYYEIVVEDTGVGMTEDQLKQLFQPFYTSKQYGIGLGLISVKNTIERHNGNILVETTPNIGTTFRILLPIVEDKETIHEQVAISEINLENKVITLIDDEKLILTTMERLLRQYGANVHCYTDPNDAIHFIGTNSKDIDLVILDMVYPSINGSEVMRQILDRCPNMKFITYSGHHDRDEVPKIDNIKAQVKKPFDFRDLLQVIGKYIDT